MPLHPRFCQVCVFQEGRKNHIQFCSLPQTQHEEHHLAHSRCSINTENKGIKRIQWSTSWRYLKSSHYKHLHSHIHSFLQILQIFLHKAPSSKWKWVHDKFDRISVHTLDCERELRWMIFLETSLPFRDGVSFLPAFLGPQNSRAFLDLVPESLPFQSSWHLPPYCLGPCPEQSKDGQHWPCMLPPLYFSSTSLQTPLVSC